MHASEAQVVVDAFCNRGELPACDVQMLDLCLGCARHLRRYGGPPEWLSAYEQFAAASTDQDRASARQHLLDLRRRSLHAEIDAIPDPRTRTRLRSIVRW